MAFPASPTDGQTYNGYIYNSTLGAWKRNAIFPIGMIYVQFPNKQSPNEMNWPGTWQDKTNEYSGAFFRAEGSWAYGGARTFESGAQEDAFQGHEHRHYYACKDCVGGTSHGFDGNSSLRYSLELRDTINITSGSSGTPRIDTETRPYNYTVKIWERTA